MATYTVEIVYTHVEEVVFEADTSLDLHESVNAYIDSYKPVNCVDTEWSILEQPPYYEKLKQND